MGLSSRSGGGVGDHGPPGPVKISHKKDGHCCDIGHVEDVEDIADMPIGRNAMIVDTVHITKMSR